jgi:hypothetical protein
MKPNDEKESEERALVDDLRTFVEGSDLSLPKIANRMEVFSATLSMWIAEQANRLRRSNLRSKNFLDGAIFGGRARSGIRLSRSSFSKSDRMPSE